MIAGEKIHNGKYTIEQKLIQEDRVNANIYLCVDSCGKKFIAKHFYKLWPMPNISYGKKNHFGRRRDGSQLVFEEIKNQTQIHNFLVSHIDRFKHKGKWIIVLDYISGTTLTEYININKDDITKVSSCVIALAKTLSLWHKNGFAHGDPHLDNCMIQFNELDEPKVSLIDYCQLHHRSFKYCQQYKCFEPNKNRRITEDLMNPHKHFGRGFKQDLINLENQLGYDRTLSNIFNEHYFPH
jgi:serine/threonine protein kinase